MPNAPISLFLTLTLLLLPSTAKTIVFHKPEACNLNRPYAQCTSIAEGFCCAAGAPYCGSISCSNCQTGINLSAFQPRGCSGHPVTSCHQQGCCLHILETLSCGAHWLGGWSERNGTMRALTADEIAANCEKLVEPDKIAYVDAQGAMHEIHVPKETFKAAAVDLVAENWDALAKFPAWANQTLAERDYEMDVGANGVEKFD